MLRAAEEIAVPAICCWEIAALVEKGRIDFSLDVRTWIGLALDAPRVRLVPLSPDIAVLATKLGPSFHRDPADRMIAATAVHSGWPLVTADQRIAAAGVVETIW